MLIPASVWRFSRDGAAVPLALDELADVAGHLADQQAHRHVGEAERNRDGDGERDEENE